jgi:hypothetical protein
MDTATKMLFMVGVLSLACLMSVPQAHAGVWNQRIRFTFSEPVAIPHAVLPAGTYWFQLLNSDSDRNVVEIFGSHGQRLVTTLLTVPTYRYAATGRVELQFAERPHDQPQAFLSWYYPGMMWGHEFVYSGRREKLLARATKEELLSSPNGSIAAQAAG